MARLVRHDAMGPYRIEPEELPRDKPLFICACGLSATMPRCDGSHKVCRAEEPGTVYVYDSNGTAVKQVLPEDSSAGPASL